MRTTVGISTGSTRVVEILMLVMNVHYFVSDVHWLVINLYVKCLESERY